MAKLCDTCYYEPICVCGMSDHEDCRLWRDRETFEKSDQMISTLLQIGQKGA